MSDVERLRSVLAATGPPPDAQELSELLWLACRMGGDEPEPPVSRRVRRVDAHLGLAEAEPDVPDAPAVAADTAPPVFDGLVPVLSRPAAAPAPAAADSGAAEVLVPTAPMLADPRGVQRALRPLKRRVPSRHRRELDEDATAARIAESGMWAPVLVPAPERWLTLGLVVDTGPTMRLWRPLARELAEALVRQGAFADVHVSYLDGDRVAGAPGAPPRAPGTLLHASGRHAVLVLSDCSGPHWWDGRAARAVRKWARTGPTAILQPLPERLWRRTAAPTSPGLALLPRPGGPNTDLRFTPFDGAAEPGVPVPVLEIAPRWLAAWAGLVAGAGPQPVSVASLHRGPAPAPVAGVAPGAAVERERELPVDERVRRFLASASPAAAELAAHVAVSVPSLPVMRLIQHRILGGSSPGRLAEVLLSGLLRPVDDLHYAFVPGAREALLDTLPRPEAQHTRHVLEAVSAEIERRAGTTAEVFRALVPSSGGRVRLVADVEHFALVSSQTRAHLTPAPVRPAPPDLLDLLDAPVDELIGEHRGRPPRPVPIGVDADGETVAVDVTGGAVGRHLEISGPRALRDRRLRTLLFSLALHHPPARIEFAFVDFSHGISFTGLGTLPHVAAAVHAMSPDSGLLDGLQLALETEMTRRKRVLRAADSRPRRDDDEARAWDASFAALPLLLVVIDNAGPLFEARPGLGRFITDVEQRAIDTGVRFLLCSDAPHSPRSTLISTGGEDDGFADLRVPGQGGTKRFHPATISLADAVPIIDRMAVNDPHARRLPWPPEGAPARPGTGPRGPATTAEDAPRGEPESAARLRDALDRLRETEAEARRVRDEVAATIAGPPPPVRPEQWAVLADRLSALDRDIQPDGDRTDRARHITDLERTAREALQDARETVDAARDRLLRREELRGRLDAHRRTANRWGLAEDDRSYRLYKQALTVLLTTPCDLEEAAAALEEFERAVSPPAPTTRPSGDRRDEVPDVLTVNRGDGTHHPVIGIDAMGDAVTPFPYGRPPDLPHGIIVGDSPSRQRMLRVLALALAAKHSAESISFAFGGMGEHPLGGPLDLPHVIRSEEELLGRPDALRGFLDFLSDEMDSRAAVSREDRTHLFVMVDVSLTFPPGRPEVADTFLKLTRRGKALNVTLVISAETVDESSTWSRFLPLADWRVLTSRLRPAEQQRFIRRPSLDFIGDRSAYILMTGTPLYRFTVASDPDEAALDAFVRRHRDRSEGGSRAMSGGRGRPDPTGTGDAGDARTGVLLGVDHESGEAVELDFEAERHLLISGLSDRRAAKLMERLIETILARGSTERDRLVYVFDRTDRLLHSDTEHPGLRYVEADADLESVIREIMLRAEDRRWGGRGPEIYIVARNRQRLLADDPLLPLLPRLAQDNGLHLIVARRQISFGDPPDPLLTRLREVGAAAVFLRQGGGREADLWGLPTSLRGSLPRGKALLVRRGEHRLFELPEMAPAQDETAESASTSASVLEVEARGGTTFVPLPDGPGGKPVALPARVHLSELATSADERVAIGVRNAAREHVSLDFDEDPHLLVVAAVGAGRTNLVRTLLKELAWQNTAPEGAAVCVFDPRGHLRAAANRLGLESPVEPGMLYTETSDAFNEFVERADAPPGNPEPGVLKRFVIVIDGNGSAGEERLLSIIRDGDGRAAPHLVLAVADGRPPTPLVSALYGLGEPLLLLGPCRGEIARPFESLLAEPMPPGRGLLVRQRQGELVALQVADASPRP